MKIARKLEKVTEINPKLDAAIRLLLEKLSQAGVDTKDKEIIIKDGKLTVN